MAMYTMAPGWMTWQTALESTPTAVILSQDVGGAKYEGDWKNDLQHGRGVEVWPDGAKYEVWNYSKQGSIRRRQEARRRQIDLCWRELLQGRLRRKWDHRLRGVLLERRKVIQRSVEEQQNEREGSDLMGWWKKVRRRVSRWQKAWIWSLPMGKWEKVRGTVGEREIARERSDNRAERRAKRRDLGVRQENPMGQSRRNLIVIRTIILP